MNSTLTTLMNNSTMTIVESWFIPVDILAILYLTLTIILAITFVFIIILDKTCHSVLMLLTANICLTGCVAACVFLAKTIFTLRNDVKQIQYEDGFCFATGYLIYATGALHNYSYVLVAIYRYLTIVFPTKLFWQSARVQIFFIGLSWLISMILPIPIAMLDPIVYNIDNQICQSPLRFSFSMIYAPFTVYIIPVHLVIFIYLKLVHYVRSMSQRITPANTLLRAQRDLKMVRRIVILVQILLISGFPMTAFAFLSFANRAPKYHFRIAFKFVEASMLCVMIALFQFTDSLKASIKKRLRMQTDVVIPVVA